MQTLLIISRSILGALLVVGLLLGSAVWGLFAGAPALQGWFPTWVSLVACLACFLGSLGVLRWSLRVSSQGRGQSQA